MKSFSFSQDGPVSLNCTSFLNGEPLDLSKMILTFRAAEIPVMQCILKNGETVIQPGRFARVDVSIDFEDEDEDEE